MVLRYFDTETHLIAPGRLAPQLVCMQTPEEILRGRAAVAQWIDWLRTGDELVGHNLPFDLLVMVAASEEYGQEEEALRLVFAAADQGRLHCTLIRERLLRTWAGTLQTSKRGDMSLAALTLLYAQHILPKEDTWRLRYAELEALPTKEWPEDAVRYALDDARWTRRVYQEQQAVAERISYEKGTGIVNEAAQVRTAWALHLVSAWGMRTDADAVAALESKWSARIDIIRPELQLAGIIRRDGSKDMANLRARVVKALGAAAPMTDGGAISTDAKTLGMAAQTDPLFAKVVEREHLGKLLGTFLAAIKQGAEHPINPTFNNPIASGRTSSSKPINIQNLPRGDGVRECFVPRKGFLYSSCDYSVEELRTLAQVCKTMGLDSQLLKALQAGKDPHIQFGAHLGGVTYERLTEMLHGQGEEKLRGKQLRAAAKVLNFGAPGGLGDTSLVSYAEGYAVKLTLDEAADLLRQWHAAWPEMKDYFRRIKEDLDASPNAQLVQHVSGRRRGGCTFTAGCNTMFQGLTADLATDALYRVVRECYLDRNSALYGSRPVAFIHDEILTEHPADVAAMAAGRVAAIMRETAERWTPDVPQIVEPALMTRWIKAAEPRFDGVGGLIPWDSEAA